MSKQNRNLEAEPSAEQLASLLRTARMQAGGDFSGLGVLVTNGRAPLPIVPLRDGGISDAQHDPATMLAEISRFASPLHDGFHILSASLRPTHIAQYFSPPIVPGLSFDRGRLVGGRYVAALYGSMLDSVLLTGIASSGFGIAVFRRGVEVLFERP